MTESERTTTVPPPPVDDPAVIRDDRIVTAMQATANGIPVLALLPGQKRPIAPDGPGSMGDNYRDLWLTTPEEVVRMAERIRNDELLRGAPMNVGLLPGVTVRERPTALLALDVDSRDGERALRAMLARIPVARKWAETTLTVRTNRGIHLVGTVDVSSAPPTGHLAHDLEVRSRPGYFLAPGCLHPKGGHYTPDRGRCETNQEAAQTDEGAIPLVFCGWDDRDRQRWLWALSTPLPLLDELWRRTDARVEEDDGRESSPAAGTTVPVEEVLRRRHLALPGRGRKISCPLPDHADRTPSCHVYETPKKGWYCFGCRRGGSALDLVALLDGHDPHSRTGRAHAFRQLRDLEQPSEAVADGPDVEIVRQDDEPDPEQSPQPATVPPETGVSMGPVPTPWDGDNGDSGTSQGVLVALPSPDDVPVERLEDSEEGELGQHLRETMPGDALVMGGLPTGAVSGTGLLRLQDQAAITLSGQPIRNDGLGLLEGGFVVGLWGKPEAGKSLVTFDVALRTVDQGGAALLFLLDAPIVLESRKVGMLHHGRRSTLPEGVMRDRLQVIPEGLPIPSDDDDAEQAWLEILQILRGEILTDDEPILLAVDHYTALVRRRRSIGGYARVSSNSTEDTMDLYAPWKRIAQEVGATVVILDHESTRSDSIGPLGSTQKPAEVDLAYRVTVRERERPTPLTPGKIRIHVGKDRHGFVRPFTETDSHLLSVVEITPTPDGDGTLTQWTVPNRARRLGPDGRIVEPPPLVEDDGAGSLTVNPPSGSTADFGDEEAERRRQQEEAKLQQDRKMVHRALQGLAEVAEEDDPVLPRLGLSRADLLQAMGFDRPDSYRGLRLVRSMEETSLIEETGDTYRQSPLYRLTGKGWNLLNDLGGGT